MAAEVTDGLHFAPDVEVNKDKGLDGFLFGGEEHLFIIINLIFLVFRFPSKCGFFKFLKALSPENV